MDEINYDEKINNFLAMTETGDPETAMKYLESENWDETKAVNTFYQSVRQNTPSNENNINFSQNNENNMITSDRNGLNRNLINNSNDNSNNNNDLIIQKIKKESIFKKIIYAPINLLPFLNNFISQICRSSMSFNILKKDFIIYPLLANTNEGNKTQDIITDSPLIFPSFVFCFNSSKYPSAILTRNHIINILESETITLKSFHEVLLETSKKLNINNNNNTNNIMNEIDKSFGPLTDAEILNQQNFDMEKLEKEAIKKEEELQKEKKKEEEKRKEEENKLKEIEEKAKEAKNKIVEEPEEGGPDSTTICFRYPDGEKSKNRRFLKSHTIQNLYDYITSLGEEIYTEKDNNHFSLYQPFPPKKYDIMENTLEKEGLFPNAVIQIREE